MSLPTYTATITKITSSTGSILIDLTTTAALPAELKRRIINSVARSLRSAGYTVIDDKTRYCPTCGTAIPEHRKYCAAHQPHSPFNNPNFKSRNSKGCGR